MRPTDEPNQMIDRSFLVANVYERFMEPLG